jgi:hypothetical protein
VALAVAGVLLPPCEEASNCDASGECWSRADIRAGCISYNDIPLRASMSARGFGGDLQEIGARMARDHEAEVIIVGVAGRAIRSDPSCALWSKRRTVRCWTRTLTHHQMNRNYSAFPVVSARRSYATRA